MRRSIINNDPQDTAAQYAYDGERDECPRLPDSVHHDEFTGPVTWGPTRWLNSLGEEVDIDTIDREYALNILTMYLLRVGAAGFKNVADNHFVTRLRKRILEGHAPGLEERRRARRYNRLNDKAGLPYRAPGVPS